MAGDGAAWYAGVMHDDRSNALSNFDETWRLDAMVARATTVSGGQISQETLAQAAALALSLGVAKTAPDFETMVSASIKLASRLGLFDIGRVLLLLIAALGPDPIPWPAVDSPAVDSPAVDSLRRV